MYHGWNDQLIAPRNTIQYLKNMEAVSGGAESLTNSARLFMAPGMMHCANGDGPNTFDTLTALEQWVEHKKAPDQIIASHSSGGRIDRTRPLCVYPKVARYVGTGSTDDASNFVCSAP